MLHTYGYWFVITVIGVLQCEPADRLSRMRKRKRKRDRPSSEAAVPLESVSGRRGRRAAEWRSNGPVETTASACPDPPPEHMERAFPDSNLEFLHVLQQLRFYKECFQASQPVQHIDSTQPIYKMYNQDVLRIYTSVRCFSLFCSLRDRFTKQVK